MAVIHRSLLDVKRFVKFPGTLTRCEPPGSTPSILELALGWLEGLSFLITLDLCPMQAIEAATALEDIPSLEILLRTNTPMFATTQDICHIDHSKYTPVGTWAFVENYGLKVSPATLRPIADELWRRCQALKKSATQFLSIDEQQTFGLVSSEIAQWVLP